MLVSLYSAWSLPLYIFVWWFWIYFWTPIHPNAILLTVWSTVLLLFVHPIDPSDDIYIWWFLPNLCQPPIFGKVKLYSKVTFLGVVRVAMPLVQRCSNIAAIHGGTPPKSPILPLGDVWQFAIEHGPVETVSFPVNSMVDLSSSFFVNVSPRGYKLI